MIERKRCSVPLPSLYICGPMRGRPEHNFPAFNMAAARFRALGWPVVNPVELGEVFNNDPTVAGSEYMRLDVHTIAMTCGAIALLPGWEASVGARCEVGVALTLGLDFYDAETGDFIEPPRRVTITGGYEQAPGVVDTLDSLRDEACAWQRVTFTQRTPASIAAHLEREAKELRKAPHDDEELADVFLLLCGLAVGRDLVGAVRAKLEKNKARTWGEPDADGVVEHVEHVADGAA